MCGGGTCQSTGFSRMQTQSSCSMPFTVQAGSHQIGTAIVVVTLPLLSAAAKRSLQSNSARFINSSSPANARRLQGHCEACQCTAVSRWVGDYIVSSGRFFFFPLPLSSRGLQPWATRAASDPQYKENVLGSCPFLPSLKTPHHFAMFFLLAPSASCTILPLLNQTEANVM